MHYDNLVKKLQHSCKICIQMIPDECKPIVVLAGWLGCKVKSLAKYVTIYESLGYTVLIRIASPYMVMRAALKPPSYSSLRKTTKETKLSYEES